MVNPVIQHLPRCERKKITRKERARREAGEWGPWETIPLPNGTGGDGWNKEVRFAHKNSVFCVLERPVEGSVVHLAVSSLSGVRPTWYEMQRIKNELAGAEATAIEIYPPEAEVVDGADMFHLWLVGSLPFSLHDDRHKELIPDERE